MTPNQFPSLIQHVTPQRAERITCAIEAIIAGVERGSIRNVELNDAKFVLGNAVNDGWHKVEDAYVSKGKYRDLPEDVLAFFDDIGIIMSLHDILAKQKRAAKSKATGEAVDAARAFLNEVLPLAEAAASLKNKVIKGRVPSVSSKPVNPDKIIKTCPCCFRQIAVVGGKMAHHGYKRPGHGHQTSSCYGIRFPPLEESTEGLVWYIGEIEKGLAEHTERYNKLDQRTSIAIAATRSKALQVITKDMPEWDATFARLKHDMELEIRQLTYHLQCLKERLAAWNEANGGVDAGEFKG